MNFQYVTVKDVARELSCHRETILRLLRLGRIPGVKIGRYWRLDRRAVVLALSNRPRCDTSRQPTNASAIR